VALDTVRFLLLKFLPETLPLDSRRSSNDRHFNRDLSGNTFTGSFPLPQIRSMVFLQQLSLGRNGFYGEIPELALQNMTQLAEL
jgi:hypothetical protein